MFVTLLVITDVDAEVGTGKVSEGLADARLQNCCAMCSAGPTSVEVQLDETQTYRSCGNVRLEDGSMSFRIRIK